MFGLKSFDSSILLVLKIFFRTKVEFGKVGKNYFPLIYNYTHQGGLVISILYIFGLYLIYPIPFIPSNKLFIAIIISAYTLKRIQEQFHNMVHTIQVLLNIVPALCHLQYVRRANNTQLWLPQAFLQPKIRVIENLSLPNWMYSRQQKCIYKTQNNAFEKRQFKISNVPHVSK